jgi:pimeloyl-ACP methyl ester carboxylesterase
MKYSRQVRKMLGLTLLLFVGFSATLSVFLFFYQRKMIYFPRRYEPSYKMGLPPNTVELGYHTPSGNQVSFYIPPRTDPDEKLKTLWVFFGGNGALTLDWLLYLDQFPDKSSGVLLVEYPGYGLCQGRPSYNSIMENSDAAFQALARQLKKEPLELEKDLNVLGHSLGAATGLEFAARHPVKRIILLAPFTSMKDMARLAVGWPLCLLLRDPFDNTIVLDQLVTRAEPPQIHIFHGEADEVAPFRMGQSLAQRHPDKIAFHPYKGVDHNSIIDAAAKEIYNIMTGKIEANQ